MGVSKDMLAGLGWAGLDWARKKKTGQQCSLSGRGVGGYGVRVRGGSGIGGER